MCNLGLGVWLAIIYIFSVFAHVLGVLEFHCLSYLCVGYARGFLEVVEEFVIELIIGYPFHYVYEFSLYDDYLFIYLFSNALYLCTLVDFKWLHLVLHLASYPMNKLQCMQRVCAICGLVFFRVVPLFAIWYAISLPINPMCAYTIVSNNIQPFHNLSPALIGARIVVHNFKHFKEGKVFYLFCGNMLLLLYSFRQRMEPTILFS